jgi:hypothetical protein
MDNNISTQSQSPTGTQISGLPVGATVDAQPYNSQQATPTGLPPGATVDDQPYFAPQTPQTPQTGMQKFTSGLENGQGPIIGNMMSGAVKSAAGTIGNVMDMLNHGLNPNSGVSAPVTQMDKVRAQSISDSYKSAHPTATPDQVSQYLNQQANAPISTHVQAATDWLRSSGQPQGFWEQVGSLGEQTVELLGLDGLSKLITVPAKAGEAAQVIDSAQHAAQLSKVATVLQSNPKIAGLIAVGLQASKDALLMGGQTYAHTEDPNQAITSGLVGGAVGGTLHGIGAIASSVLEKGGQAAEDVNSIRNAAQNAPTGNEVNNQLNDKVNDAFEPAIQKARDSTVNAYGDIAKAQQAQIDAAAKAPSNESITEETQKAVQAAHDKLMSDYQTGLNSLNDVAEGQTLAYDGSPLKQAAQSLLKQGSGESRALDTAFSVNRPGSEGANLMLSKLANPSVPGIQLDMQELIDRRQQIGELLRGTGWQTDEQLADRDIYKNLLQGTDNSIQQLLKQSGNEEAVNTLKNMNANYKAGIGNFDNTDVKALLKGTSDSVQKRMLAGGTSLADINTLRNTIGEKAFQQLSNDSVSRMAADSVSPATGELDWNGFFKKWNGISDESRTAFLGASDVGKSLQEAIDKVLAVNKSGVIPWSEQTVKDATNDMSNLLKNGDISSLLKDTNRVEELRKVVGDQAMGELGQSVIQNKLREASTNINGQVGNIDTRKFLAFIDSLKNSSEVVNGLFKPTPETAAAYNQVVSQVKNVHNAKLFTKLGLGAAGLGVGAAGGLLGHVFLALEAGAGGAAGLLAKEPILNFLDRLANTPLAWNTLKALDNIGNNAVTKTAGKVGRYAVSNAAANGWKQATTNSLSGK